jgi:hypothetical protein
MAFGNSDGDREMLEYTQGSGGARFELLVLDFHPHLHCIALGSHGPSTAAPPVVLWL